MWLGMGGWTIVVVDPLVGGTWCSIHVQDHRCPLISGAVRLGQGDMALCFGSLILK